MDLPGGISRFDWMALDPETHTLYIAHMGAGQIVVFDIPSGKVKTTLSGFPKVTGLCIIPELHRLYASVAGLHQVFVVDTDSLKVVTQIPAGHFPDNLTYVPDLRHLYVSDEVGGEVTVIDVLKNKRIASIHLGGEVGQVRFDPSSGMVYANVQATNELVGIDPKDPPSDPAFLHPGRQTSAWALGGPGPSSDLHRLRRGQQVDRLRSERLERNGRHRRRERPDLLAYDPGLGYLYVACESGTVSVMKVHDDKVEKVGDFPVGENAHSVLVDPDTHFVYFPLRKMGKGPVLRTMKPTR